jgi:methionyl-tRNA synthetase
MISSVCFLACRISVSLEADLFLSLSETKEPADLAAQRRAILSDKLLAVLARHRKTSPESSNEKMQDAVSLALSSKSIHENELRPRSSSINESNSKTASRRRVSEILAIKSTVAKRMEGKPGWQIRKRGTKEEIVSLTLLAFLSRRVPELNLPPSSLNETSRSLRSSS